MTDVQARTNVWETRRRRARTLAQDRAHASELLHFYVALADVQERIHDRAAHQELPGCGERRTLPSSWLHDLPGQSLVAPFREFVSAISTSATETIRAVGRTVESGDAGLLTRLLTSYATQMDLAALANELSCGVEPLTFFPRAFLQPITEAIREEHGAVHTNAETRRCPHCGFPPQAGVFHDLADVKGQRQLVCSLCSSSWPFPRLMCPRCDTRAAESLLHHTSESWSHARVEECQQCRTYIKAFDLRIDGAAVPLVDDIASVELDLWAVEQGLTKLQPNIVGL